MSKDISAFKKLSPSSFSGLNVQLNEFLCRRQLALLEQSDKRRNEINSLEALGSYTQTMRQTFLDSFGGIPERDCPLNAKTTKTIDMGSYVIEDVIYNPRKNVYATASLYLPKGISTPAPAVLLLSGHRSAARMADTYQEVCQILVKSGLIVFAIDTIGQGERKNFYDRESGEYLLTAPVWDHDYSGIPSMCTGKFLEAYFLNEQFAAVDYLLTRKEVDPKRIGVTGNSGGGLQTVCMMACDERIAAAAPATFTTTRREMLYTGQSQDQEQIWPSCANYGFDHFEPFMIFAPKPAMILAVSSDFFPIEGTLEVYNKAKEIYALYGKENNIEMVTDKSCHHYTHMLADAAAEFFCRVFGIEKQVRDDNLCVLPVEQMNATKSGNVLGDFEDAKCILHETAERAEALRKNRKKDEARAWLTEKVYKDRLPFKPNLRISDRFTSEYTDEYTGKAAMWWVQERLAAYGILISKGRNEQPLTCPTVIALWDNGTKAIEEHKDWILSVCDSGKQVLVLDLPGVGSIEQARLWFDFAYREQYGTSYKMCADLLYMGDSMAAMHTYHLIRTVEMLKTELGISDVTLYCAEQEGVYGVMAGYLCDIKREYADSLMRSVEEKLIKNTFIDHDNTMCYLIPGMLEYFDYNELM